MSHWACEYSVLAVTRAKLSGLVWPAACYHKSLKPCYQRSATQQLGHITGRHTMQIRNVNTHIFGIHCYGTHWVWGWWGTNRHEQEANELLEVVTGFI